MSINIYFEKLDAARLATVEINRFNRLIKEAEKFELYDIKIKQKEGKETISATIKTCFGRCEIEEFINKNMIGARDIERGKSSYIKNNCRSDLKKIFNTFVFFDCPIDQIYDAFQEEIRKIFLPF